MKRKLLIAVILLILAVSSGCRARSKRQAARATALARTPTAVAQAPTETAQPGPSPSPVAAPVEAPAAGEAILFQDDFQDGRADDTWQVQSAWTVQQDGERYTFDASGQGLAWVQGGGEWTDYAYRAAVRLSAGSASLIFRGSRQGRYELHFTPQGTSLRRQPAAAAATTLAESDLVLAAGRWHKVAIVARGGQFVVRVDDAPALSATDDDPLLAGTVGVLAEAAAEISVDNVLVIALGPAAGATPIAEAPTVPRIHSFTTDDEVITAGQCTNLRWQVSGAERVTINQRPVSGDWLEVCPTETTRYLLRADGQQATVSIEVLPRPSPFSGPPRIVSFDADEAFLLPGQATTLRRDVREAQLIQINDRPWLQVETSMPVRPAETTTYRLVAINNLGFKEAEFTVEVGELPSPPVIHEFDADDGLLIPPERSTTLRWHVTGADLVKLAWLRFPDGVVMDQPNYQVSPRETTEYTLEAYVQGRDEPVTRSLVVEVGEPRFSGPPRIVQFDPDHPYLEQGQPKEIGAGCTLLHWQVENATQITLNGEDVSSATNYRVCPKVTRSYTLVAGRPGQEPAQATTTVQVGQTRGAGAGEYLEIVDVRQVDGQTAEVTVNYGLEAGHEEIVRLAASALVWNDASAEEQALPQFRSPPLAVRPGQRQATLTLTYRGCRGAVSDHVRVEIIERQQAEAGSPEEYVAVSILSAAYEHPDMVWQPVNRILGVRAWRGLLANELNVLVAYCYSGDQGEEVWLGARPSGGDVQEDAFGYVPAHIQAGQSGLARITARYNGQYPSHSEALRVFMRLPPPAKDRFAKLEIPFPHDWAPDDIRIMGIRRATPDDVEVPRGSLLVDVAYALNSRPDVMVEFSAWPEDSSAHLLLSVPHEQWRVQQGHGVQTFQVSYDGYQTVETHYLKARLAKPYDIAPDGSVTLPVLIEDTRPFTHTWTSKLVTTLGSGWDCKDLLVPMRGLDGRNWTLEFTSGDTCTVTFTPCAEQKQEHYDAPGLHCQATDIVRISSPNVDIWSNWVMEPIEVQYVGSPDLTVAVHAGDRPLPAWAGTRPTAATSFSPTSPCLLLERMPCHGSPSS